MKPFVLDRREKVEIGAMVLLGCIVMVVGELVTELVYLPLYVLLAVLWLVGKLRGPTGGARSTGSR